MPDPRAPGPVQSVGLSLTLRENGAAWIHVLSKGASGTSITIETLRELEEQLTRLEGLGSEGRVTSVILATTPPHLPLGGYVLDLATLPLEEDVVAWSHEAQRILRLLETLGVASVAAMQEDWIGGAAELALACSYRVAALGSGARIGFPQTALGFLPAWGGTVRLPRLVGLRAALRLILSGDGISVEEAAAVGLVDELVSTEDFTSRVEQFADERLSTRRTRPLRRRLLGDTAPARRLALAGAGRHYLADGRGGAPARTALDLLSKTLGLPLELAFARESSAAGQLALLEEVQDRLHSQRVIARVSSEPSRSTTRLDSAAVIGAGRTGSDLAHLLAAAGLPVRIKDGSRNAVNRGIARTRERLRWEADRSRISEAVASELAARIDGVTGYGGFGTLDLVVATSDAGKGVEEILVEVEPHVRRSCILAFHDWGASPSRFQCRLEHPRRVVGLLPVLPLEHFKLLEIVPGPHTAPEVVAAARELASHLSVLGIEVSETTPSPATRLLAIFFAEASRLLDEGATVDQVDAALQEFGFQVGPFNRMDAIGGDRVLDLLAGAREKLGHRAEPGQVLRRFAETGRTFYRYKNDQPVQTHPDLPRGLSPAAPAVARLVKWRVLLALINEAGRIIEDGGVHRPEDLEAISILGLGFPSERGGLLHHAERLGLAKVVADLVTAAQRNGPRYEPARLLRTLAECGDGFFEPAPPTGMDSHPGR
jgi:3-hydroxyacyl-CoA dehydrogenase / enoyl-CoA hydratase / 3-hydroxybutyryl-CoA epimerase